MLIRRYKIIEDLTPGMFRVVDKLKDTFVSIPLVVDDKEFLESLMGKDMEELIDSNRVHPDYLKEEKCLRKL